jgi:uncharacterized delta-60 repeat protein
VIPGRKTPRGALRLALAALVAAIVLVAAAVAGADGTGEASTFGADGIATQVLGTHYAQTGFTSAYARPDGGLVAQQGERIVAFGADGSPDSSFSAPPDLADGESSVAPAAGGKTFVVGYLGLSRLNPDGSLDTGFGKSGTVAGFDGARAVAELPSGKIVVISVRLAGARNPNDYVGITLLNQDGSTAAKETILGEVSGSYAGTPIKEFVPAPGGGLLVVAAGFLFELNADGSPNMGFGSHGVQYTYYSVIAARFMPDGSIEAVGPTYVDSDGKEKLALIDFSATGAPASPPGKNAGDRYEPAGQVYAQVASWGADGSVVVGGRTEGKAGCAKEECEEAPALAAFDPAGNLDPGFGEGGVLRLGALAGPPQGFRSDGVTALARRADGSIVALGNAPPNQSTAFLAALSAGGALVGSFGEGGIERVREPVPAEERVGTLAPLPEGKLLAVGSADVGIQTRPVLVRYRPDGSLDPSFGGGAGYVAFAESGSPSTSVVGDGKVLVDVYDESRNRVLMVDAGSGAVDSSFGSGGAVSLPKDRFARSLALGSGGDPVVLESSYHPGRRAPVTILRFLPTGRPDPKFGHRGRLTLRPPGGGEVAGEAMVAAPGGRLLFAGMAREHLFVARLLADGRTDPHFGSHGWSITRVKAPERAVALALDGNHIDLAAISGPKRRLVLIRFDSHGHLVKGFGKAGVRSAAPEGSYPPSALIPTPKGAVVLTERGNRPIVTFGPHGKGTRTAVGPPGQAAWQVTGTASKGHLILGWHPLTFGKGNNSGQFFLSERSLG